jgi:Protein of unknown function (DUF1549)/Protein of unknown function (DUF1553)
MSAHDVAAANACGASSFNPALMASRKAGRMTSRKDRVMVFSRVLVACAFGGLLFVSPLTASASNPQATAKRVDELLAKEQFGGDEKAKAVSAADDQTFLRRASLDLVGVGPTPEEITAYSLDTSSDKRARAVERLLASERFGENWARYWRDVIMYRRTEDRALLATPALLEFLTGEFNDRPHWDQIARKFITAVGDVSENGAAALIMAQMGGAEDTTAEVSRIFMGIQIQCAQCHNHPTDRWKREQFHELAAFFPRLSLRPVKVDGKRRSFAVVSVDKDRGNKRPNNPRVGATEHYMPDLDHPEAEGTLMKPVFFVSGQKLETGVSDSERREKIAGWITDRDNAWFSKAFVNRMWSELVGTGFYEPVDDIGPDRSCDAPLTLDYLSEQFTANDYDVKWLFQAITSTAAYGRQSRSRMDDETAPFVSACPQRLRGDQLFNTLIEVLEIPEPPSKGDGGYRRVGGPREQVNRTFGYDPSVRRDEVAGSIPQALFLMNAPELAQAINSKNARSSLSRLLAEVPEDKPLVSELYLRCLAREPKQSELQTCLDHVRTSDDRAAAFEDILWALVNSTEFLNRK